MKSAKSWQDEWIGRWPIPVPQIGQIEAIQKDAYQAGLLRAAQIVRDDTDPADGAIHDEFLTLAGAIESEAKHHETKA